MTLHDISLIAIFISLIAIFISFIPFLKTLYEDYGKPALPWRSCETVEKTEERKKLEELIKKYNVPTELQKNLSAVTEKYFLMWWFKAETGKFGRYWIYSRQPDGTLGENKGEIKFFGSPFAVFESEDELNEMCDEEVQGEPLKRRRRVMQDRFTSL
jgi:hypothetical protein